MKIHIPLFRLIAYLSVVMLIPVPGRGAGCRRQQPDFVQILKKADALVTFPDTDFSAMYSFVQEVPGQSSTSKQAMVFRRDRENTYLIVMVQPEEDRGKGYLKSGNNLWYYARFVKPLDENLILSLAAQHGRVLTVEENVLAGGFGSAILELLADRGLTVAVKRLGIPDIFVEHGAPAILRRKYGLDADGILKGALSVLGSRPNRRRWSGARSTEPESLRCSRRGKGRD